MNTFGNGLFMTISVLFFTRSVGLSAAQVGLGLTIAGACGLLAGIPMGHLADHFGARGVLLGLLPLMSVAELGYLLVHAFGGFVVVAAVVSVLDRGASAVRNALIAGVLSPTQRVRGRAYLRSVTNLGISLGTVAGGAAIHADTRAAYVTLIVIDCASYLVAAAVLTRVPRVAPHPGARDAGRTVVFRDRPYLAICGLQSLLAIHYGLLEVAVPLWIVERTAAPRWSVALVLLVNTVVCVLFQVRASRGIDDPTSSALASRRAGWLLAASCALFALSAGGGAGVALAVLVGAALVQVLGELQQAAGSWGLGFGLAPDHLQGQYQGVYSTTFAVSGMLAPVVVTTVAVTWGWPGWLLLAAMFAATGMVMPRAAAWAERTRPAPLAATATA